VPRKTTVEVLRKDITQRSTEPLLIAEKAKLEAGFAKLFIQVGPKK